MEITFLGTASNHPAPSRNVSCLSLRYEGEVWLFDVGEASQIQLMKSSIKAGKVTKIFITHLHGDHLFGLPGLLCTISQTKVDNKVMEIYGPVGLRRFVRTTLELSRSMVTYKYVVHELVPLEEQIPDDVKDWTIIETEDSYLHPSEIQGRQIRADEKHCWNLFENDVFIVKASWIKHRIPCFGFVVEQKPTQGRLDAEGLLAHGVKPGPLYKKIKSGENITLGDGTTLEANKFIGPSKPGKKIAILGDCSECPKGILDLAQNSDCLIHEATLENGQEEKALAYGHSTPRIAAEVANKINAKCLILNHFSQRYKPAEYFKENADGVTKAQSAVAEEDEIEDTVQKLVDEARLSFSGNLLAAYDFFTYKIS